jgi:hypothetical protein
MENELQWGIMDTIFGILIIIGGMFAWRWLGPILDRPHYPYQINQPKDPMDTLYFGATLAAINYVTSEALRIDHIYSALALMMIPAFYIANWIISKLDK